nr:InlB B-repeat-containing protein [Maliibacterium massiliense]
MKKRLFAAFVSLCIIMSMLPTMVFAEGVQDSGIVTSESGLCEHHTQHDESCGYTEGTAEIPCSHEHNENCGGLTDPEACNHTHDKACDFVPATEGTPCTFVCEVCNAQDSGNPATPSDAQPEECTCETLCTGEEINGDCPVCSAEGAELDKVCVGAAPMLPVTVLAAGEHDSHSNNWMEFTAGTTTLSGGSYYLSGDVEYSGTESITVSGEVILCLNDHKLDLKGRRISVGSGASFTLCDCSTGGVLTGGSDSARNGGGVYVAGGGTFTMTGGSIAGNTAAAGGGVYVDEGGTFTMAGGSINNNKATSGGGGGVMVNLGTFTLSGGSITGNATNDETYGSGGGVCLYGTFYLSGDSIIQNNTKAGSTDNLYLGWQTINITGPLGENAHIGVTAENVPRSFISGWSNNMVGENPADYFSSDGDACGIGLNANGDVVLGSLCTTITLNPNGGALPEYSLVAGAALPIPTKTGYTFAGWYENQEFSGDPVTDVPTDSTKNLNFYAKWTANTYTVIFDANGGSVNPTSAVTVAGKLTSLPTPTYDGYDFIGWYTQKDGGEKVTTDTVFAMDSTIYAHWSNIPVTSLELNKGTLTIQEKDSDTLTVTVKPADATNQDVTWESSNTSIATVSEDGTVTAISAGNATITATAADGSGISASCTLTVTHGKMVQTPKKDATCTVDGTEEYWMCEICGKHFEDESGTIPTTPEENKIQATGHSYGEPVWNWSEDGKTCTVTFTCEKDETHKETPKVIVTSAEKTPGTCTETGVTTYTATVEFNGQTYTDTKDLTDIPATGHSYDNGKCTVCGAIASDFKVIITAGANGSWQKGTKDGLTFTSNAAYKHFQKVQVDGKDLDASNYTVKEGSTIVNLKTEYLETLSVGKHTLAIVSETGTATTEFTVKAAAVTDDTQSPQTGDDSNIALWIAVLLAAGTALTGTAVYSRKRKYSK